MEKYEYYITRDEKFSNAQICTVLDKFSADGWELITVTPINANGTTIWINYVMRRLRG